MSTKIINVALTDDHNLFRSGLAALIKTFNGYNILFEAGNGQELINKMGGDSLPEIILLDINMPQMDGFETARWLKVNHPSIPVIILSMYANEEKVLEMVSLGIKGYLLKDAEPQDFKTALELVAANQFYYPEFVTNHLIKSNKISDQPKLNEREIAFLKLAGTELTYKEIADQMCVSIRTVDGYRDQLFEKLQVKNRVGMVLYSIKHGIIKI